jgi:O-methyltransferase involved in polyketide biosynthesis
MSLARIAPTAHYTAYAWHRLGFPHAEHFATATGRRLFWSFRLAGEWLAAAHPTVPSMIQYLELRHRSIELALEEARPDRIVELGAGLSRRGLTWAADRDVDYVEVDLPHMVEAKRAIISERVPADVRARARGRLRHEAVDVLGSGFDEWLARTLEGAVSPVVIAEGVLGYFDLEERRRVARAIAGGLAGRGAFVCDLRAREGGRSVAVGAKMVKVGIWLVTRGRGAREDFESSEAIVRFFEQAGFSQCGPIPVEAAAPWLRRLRSPVKVWRAFA